MENGGYKLKKITEGITLLYGFAEECCIYVVEGTEKVAVIDTGLGTGNIPEAAAAIAPGKELVVFNTHCHFDHSMGNVQFPEVHMHPGCYADQDETENMREMREVILEGLPRFKSQRVPVKEGDIFDLGGVQLEVIETPGHTPGCICLLDRAHRVVFAGDTIGTTKHDVWMLAGLPWVKFSTVSIECFLRSLLKLQALGDDYDGFLGGHDGEILGKEYLEELISMCKGLIDGTAKGEVYDLPSPPGAGKAQGLRLAGKNANTAILYQEESIFGKKEN